MNKYASAFGNFSKANTIVFQNNGKNGIVNIEFKKGYNAINSAIARVENKKRFMSVEQAVATKDFDGLMYNAIKTERESIVVTNPKSVQVGIFRK